MNRLLVGSSQRVWRSVGFWLALVIGLVQAFYAVQAFIDPIAFAEYRGAPVAAAADVEWVRIYASRTLFVAMVIGFLLWRRDLATLKWVALLGTVMPIGDAILAYQAEAPTAAVLRHVATVIYLVVTFWALHAFTSRDRGLSYH
jgi:hypothetical protein